MVSVDAAGVVGALKRAVFGAPKCLIADCRCYITAEFKSFCAEHKIDLHFIPIGSSRANELVERVMRSLKSLLTIVKNDPSKHSVTS